MSYIELSRKDRKARKQHQCMWCAGIIAPGEIYSRVASTYEGSFQDQVFHPECKDACGKYCNNGNGEFEPYEHERPTRLTASTDAERDELRERVID